jgi:sigma-B regulation protein RsbU (phosphoserine phosphatase)
VFVPSVTKLEPGDRVVIVTDGVTEAENDKGEMFGDERLELSAIAAEGPCFDHIFASVRTFCGNTQLSDDCTLLELSYRGRSKNQTDSHHDFQLDPTSKVTL